MSAEEVKEKLEKLIWETGYVTWCARAMAEELIQNGVTIQEWVSVDERLPEESLNSVLGWDEYRERCVFVQYYKGEWILGNHESVKVTHWMPLPQPPKEAQR